MRKELIAISLGFLTCLAAEAQESASNKSSASVITWLSAGNTGIPEITKPVDPYFEPFHPLQAPEPKRHFLKPHDKVAICGDSITQQKKGYSRIMETYLTVCTPEMDVTVRRFGWGGEVTGAFLKRMTNDCLRFDPTIATTCYGMNDHHYTNYANDIGTLYSNNSTAIVESFKQHGVRVVLGSAGSVGAKPPSSTNKADKLWRQNMNLCQLRNIDIEIAKKEKVQFADVFWPMLTSGIEARQKYGTDYGISGPDGVHPNWAGHVVIAYAFLHAFGLDGNIGTFTVDMKSNKAKVSAGHELIGFKDGQLEIKSHRYPFCLGEGDPAKDDNILSGTQWVPFNDELNRFMLVMKRPQAKSYKITWGLQSKSFTAEQLTKGINLAAEFPVNPFSEAFNKVDEAVAAKQNEETREINIRFPHLRPVPPRKQNLNWVDTMPSQSELDAIAAKGEKEREPFVTAIKDDFVPVTHIIKFEPES